MDGFRCFPFRQDFQQKFGTTKVSSIEVITARITVYWQQITIHTKYLYKPTPWPVALSENIPFGQLLSHNCWKQLSSSNGATEYITIPQWLARLFYTFVIRVQFFYRTIVMRFHTTEWPVRSKPVERI